MRGVMRHAVLKAESVVVSGRFHGTVEASTLEARPCIQLVFALSK